MEPYEVPGGLNEPPPSPISAKEAKEILYAQAWAMMDDFFDNVPSPWWSNILRQFGYEPTKENRKKLLTMAARLSLDFEKKANGRSIDIIPDDPDGN